MMKNTLLKAGVFALILGFISAGSAQAAYIDPNAGGMLFQILAVAIGLFSGFILFFSSRIKKAFYRGMRSLRGEQDEAVEETPTPDPTEGNE